jgi:hypothetical protein
MRLFTAAFVILMLFALDRAVTGGAGLSLIYRAMIYVVDLVFGGLMNLLR